MSRRSRLYGRPCLCWRVPPVPISVPENKTQAAAIAGVSRKIKLIVSYAFSVILLVGSGGATYSPVLKCTIIVKNSIPPRLTFFPSGCVWYPPTLGTRDRATGCSGVGLLAVQQHASSACVFFVLFDTCIDSTV